jgi:hypothetical protein
MHARVAGIHALDALEGMDGRDSPAMTREGK